MNLRCSSLPLALICGASQRTPKLVIESRSDASDLGTEVHRALQGMVERDTWDYDALSDNAKWLVTAGFKAWKDLRASFPYPVCEQPLECELVTPNGTEFTLSGHPDVWSDSGHALDWKTSRVDQDYSGQMLGYCAIMLLLELRLPEATCTIVWLRDATFEQYRMTREQLPEFLERLYAVAEWPENKYVTGGHCDYCKRRHECEAWTAMARRDVSAFSHGIVMSHASLEEMSSQQKVALLAQADCVKDLAERVRAAVKAHVQAHGDIEGVTHRLTIETSEKRHLDTMKAWPVLEQLNFDDETTAGIVAIKLSALEDAVAKAAPKRGGAKAIRDLREKLEAAEAIKLIPDHRLVTRRR